MRIETRGEDDDDDESSHLRERRRIYQRELQLINVIHSKYVAFFITSKATGMTLKTEFFYLKNP